MRPLFAVRRATEATPDQIVLTGAAGGSYGADPIDGDLGYRRAGRVSREVPYWTREKAITASVASYRVNPLAKAIVDTYTAFAVGDSGVSYECSNPEVSKVVEEFWTDPRNRIAERQEVELRSTLLHGEKLLEMMVGDQSGVVRFCPVDPAVVEEVTLLKGNPDWPDKLILRPTEEGTGERATWKVVQVDDTTGLRDGKAMFWTPFRTLDTDVRSQPFLMPILDWLDSYDNILSNLMDRTALARYLVWTVKVAGGQDEVDAYVNARGGVHIPPSGTIEVHNESVEWTPRTVPSNAEEDSVAAKGALTLIAAGTGLAKTWLADPEDSNRATSLTMAEPVRRRVGGVQKVWLAYQTERIRFVIDRAVAAKRLPETVEVTDPRTQETYEIPASQSCIVTGPEIAAADATITANVLLNLSTGLEKLVESGLISREAGKVAVRKAWESFVGIPYRSELDSPEANPDDVATYVDEQDASESKLLKLAT